MFSYTVVLSLNASTAISITDLHTCCMSDFRYFHIVACKTVWYCEFYLCSDQAVHCINAILTTPGAGGYHGLWMK